MIRAVVDFALSHRWFMLAFGIFLFGLGIVQFHHLSIEAYPDVANNYAWIITQWPGRAAEEIEQQVTIPIENVMSGIPYRTYLRSVSIAGLSVVIIWFDDNSDNFQNRQRNPENLFVPVLFHQVHGQRHRPCPGPADCPGPRRRDLARQPRRRRRRTDIDPPALGDRRLASEPSRNRGMGLHKPAAGKEAFRALLQCQGMCTAASFHLVSIVL